MVTPEDVIQYLVKNRTLRPGTYKVVRYEGGEDEKLEPSFLSDYRQFEAVYIAKLRQFKVKDLTVKSFTFNKI